MKLIAYDITNLTDARYYAARGAHAIGFSSMASSLDEINAMKEWLDVPLFFIRLKDNITAEELWEIRERTGIAHYLVQHIEQDVINLFPDVSWITFHDEANEASVEVDYLFHEHVHGDLESAIKHFVLPDVLKPYDEADYNGFMGFLFSGSEEDKVGLKSYDEIDDFLDQVDIEYY